MKINITSGECLNHILEALYPEEEFVPFNEAMIKGGYSSALFGDAFIAERSAVHGVDEAEYRKKLAGFLSMLKHIEKFDEIIMWFGDEPFCVKNRETVLEALKLYGYRGSIILNTVTEETGEITGQKKFLLP